MKITDRSPTESAVSDQATDRQTAAGQTGTAEPVAEDGGDILTLVCLKCGTEYYFSEGSQPAEMTCDKCGNTVFRSFLSRADERESEEYEEATHRDLRTDDPEGDTLPGDLLDLDRV